MAALPYQLAVNRHSGSSGIVYRVPTWTFCNVPGVKHRLCRWVVKKAWALQLRVESQAFLFIYNRYLISRNKNKKLDSPQTPLLPQAAVHFTAVLSFSRVPALCTRRQPFEPLQACVPTSDEMFKTANRMSIWKPVDPATGRAVHFSFSSPLRCCFLPFFCNTHAHTHTHPHHSPTSFSWQMCSIHAVSCCHGNQPRAPWKCLNCCAFFAQNKRR
jgi:hypothetical protein